MECRTGCGVCCIALSMSSPIPGMPGGKPAGVRCVQLTEDMRCQLFGLPERPPVCSRIKPDELLCGSNPEEALAHQIELERLTRPDQS